MFIGAHDLFVAELQPLFELGVYIFQSRYFLESPLSNNLVITELHLAVALNNVFVHIYI